MEFSSWLVFLVISIATTSTPGPGVLLAIANSVKLGPRKALASSAGNVLGIFIVASAATAGLGLILRSSATAFLLLKILGASYLVYLGLRQWRSKTSQFAAMNQIGHQPQAKDLELFWQGLFVALTNPKSILFFTALFPQFMSTENFSLVRFLILTGTFSTCAVISHVGYIFLAGKAKKLLVNNTHAKTLNKTSGLLFIGLGLSLLSLRAGTH